MAFPSKEKADRAQTTFQKGWKDFEASKSQHLGERWQAAKAAFERKKMTGGV